MTFRDLKDKINALPESALDHNVIMVGEETSYKVFGLDVTTEEWISVGDGLSPRSEYQSDFDDGEITEESITSRWPPGFPFLVEDF